MWTSSEVSNSNASRGQAAPVSERSGADGPCSDLGSLFWVYSGGRSLFPLIVAMEECGPQQPLF